MNLGNKIRETNDILWLGSSCFLIGLQLPAYSSD